MQIRYLVLTSRYLFRGLTYAEMKRKVECFKEICIPYEVYQEVEIVKVEYRKIKI